MVSEVIHAEYHAALRAVELNGNKDHIAGIVSMRCARGKPEYRLEGICAIVELRGEKVVFHKDLFFYGDQEEIRKTSGYLPSFRDVRVLNASGECDFPWPSLTQRVLYDSGNYIVPIKRLPLHNGKKTVLPALVDTVRKELPAMFADTKRISKSEFSTNFGRFGCFPSCLSRMASIARTYHRAQLEGRLHCLINGAYNENCLFLPSIRLQSPIRGTGYSK
jgi:hypothetical protein